MKNLPIDMASLAISTRSTRSSTRNQQHLGKQTSTIQNNYVMNRSRAMRKKASAVIRPDLSVDSTSDNLNHVFSLNPGVFETVRIRVDAYLCNQGAEKQLITDSKGQCHTVSYKRIDKGQPQYTVNLYLTTSRIMVNGKNTTHFLTQLREIVSSTDKQTAASINELILRANSTQGSMNPLNKDAALERSVQPRKPSPTNKKSYLITLFLLAILSPVLQQNMQTKL